MYNFISQLRPSDLIVWRKNKVAQHLKTSLGFQVVTDEEAFWQYDFSEVNRLVILKELDWKDTEQLVSGRKILQDWSLNFHFWQLPVSLCSIVQKKNWQKIENLEALFEAPSKKSRLFCWNHIGSQSSLAKMDYLKTLKRLFVEMNHQMPAIHESSIYAILDQFNSFIKEGALEKAKSIHYKCMRGKLALLKICLQKSKSAFSDPRLLEEVFSKDQCLIDLLNQLMVSPSILVQKYSPSQIQDLITCLKDHYLSKESLLSQTILQYELD